MDNQRDAHRLEAAPGQFRTVRGRRGRQSGAGDVREVDPRLFEHRAVGQHAAAAAAAFFTRPLVFGEHGAAVGLGELRADVILQRQQEGFYFSDVR